MLLTNIVVINIFHPIFAAFKDRYPKRNIPRVNYKAVEVPDDDAFICKSLIFNSTKKLQLA